MPLEHGGAVEIARRSRGTPRIANRLLKRVRDYAEVRADGAVTTENSLIALALFEVDARGLDKVDRAILSALCETFGGRPVGLHTLAVAVAEEPDTVEEVYEPFLLKAGMLERTPRGPGGDARRARAPAPPGAGHGTEPVHPRGLIARPVDGREPASASGPCLPGCRLRSSGTPRFHGHLRLLRRHRAGVLLPVSSARSDAGWQPTANSSRR